jgi:ribonuclease J
VLFSHAHMDHWGLIDELPEHWPLMAGEKTAALMRLTAGLFGARLTRPIDSWTSRSAPFPVGPFTITPILTDHSAPDAYMLLIDGAGRRILYTGDFRLHGRKSALVEAMIARPPTSIDVLIMEGTNLGSDKPVMTERALERAFVKLARATPGHIFVNWSAQNIDRTVTLFRAARRTGRRLVVDLYGADVLQQMGPGTALPVPGEDWADLRVVITPGGQRLYARQGRRDWLDAMARSGFATSRQALIGQSDIIMTRDSMLGDFARAGLGFTPRDAFVFSNWRGYLDEGDTAGGWKQAGASGASVQHMHTSGHASAMDLERFAQAMALGALVPVHGVAWDEADIMLPLVHRLDDGERWRVS